MLTVAISDSFEIPLNQLPFFFFLLRIHKQEIIFLMANHVDADKASLIAVKTMLDLAKRAKESYKSSKFEEKRQILNFLF